MEETHITLWVGTLLEGIWWLSLFLAGISLLTMAGLVLRRMLIERRKRWSVIRRGELTTTILECLDKPKETREFRKQLADKKELQLAHEIIDDLWHTVRGDLRLELVSLLRDIGGLESALHELNARDARIRLHAIERLRVIDDVAMIEPLKAALDDKSPAVRLAAAQTLTSYGASIDVFHMIQKLGIGTDSRSQGLRTLFRDLMPGSGPDMIRLLNSEQPELVHLLAIQALGISEDYSIISVLAAKLDSPSIKIRVEVMRALASLHHPSALPYVSTALHDSAWEIRAQAAITAGCIGLEKLIPRLAELLEDEEWWTRFHAAEALKRMGNIGLKKLQLVSDNTPKSLSAQIAQTVLAEGIA